MYAWESFRYCPKCGAASEPEWAGSATAPFRCGSCEHTYYFNPGVGVAGIVVDSDKRLLFLRRGREPHKGQLGLPGGFVDIGEGVDDAVCREIREEVNLTVDRLEFLCSHPNVYEYRGVAYSLVDVFFVCSVADLSPLKCDTDEIAEVFFVKPQDIHLELMAFESNRQAVREYLAL